jgi:hypothetical protein
MLPTDGGEAVSDSSQRIAQIWTEYEDGSWVALGRDPDGVSYTAFADSLKQLRQQIRESAKAKGWTGLVIYQ